MNYLYVWMHGPNGSLRRVGVLVTTDPSSSNGRFESEFEYDRDWVSDPQAFSLDPVSLPMHERGQRFRAEQFHPPLAIFDDALPDDWGRRLLAAAIKLDGKTPTPAQMLLKMAGGGTGALVFSETSSPPQPLASVQSTALPTLISAAERFEEGSLPTNDELRVLFEGSSRAGGARPKALVHDDEGEWIAKFPSHSRDGTHDVVGLEATCLKLARDAGLQVPDSRLETLGHSRALLVRRFDIAPAGGRFHMISLRTLCRERPGIYVHDYTTLAKVIGKHSKSPVADTEALFRHMAFNAAVGNVDDHLKNFWMLGTAEGYRLSPSFDLVPDVTGRGEHVLSFQYDSSSPTRKQLLAVAEAWPVPDAAQIIDRVVKATSTFEKVASKVVKRSQQLERVCADVRARTELLSKT